MPDKVAKNSLFIPKFITKLPNGIEFFEKFRQFEGITFLSRALRFTRFLFNIYIHL